MFEFTALLVPFCTGERKNVFPTKLMHNGTTHYISGSASIDTHPVTSELIKNRFKWKTLCDSNGKMCIKLEESNPEWEELLFVTHSIQMRTNYSAAHSEWFNFSLRPMRGKLFDDLWKFSYHWKLKIGIIQFSMCNDSKMLTLIWCWWTMLLVQRILCS